MILYSSQTRGKYTASLPGKQTHEVTQKFKQYWKGVSSAFSVDYSSRYYVMARKIYRSTASVNSHEYMADNNVNYLAYFALPLACH